MSWETPLGADGQAQWILIVGFVISLWMICRVRRMYDAEHDMYDAEHDAHAVTKTRYRQAYKLNMHVRDLLVRGKTIKATEILFKGSPDAE